MSYRDDFMARLRQFLADKQMNPTAFGLAALNDPNFVADLEKGRNPRTDTMEKAERFMDLYPKDEKGGAAA